MTKITSLLSSISVAAVLVATSSTSRAQTPASPPAAKPAPAAPAAAPAAAKPAVAQPAAAKPAPAAGEPAKPAAQTAEKVNIVLVHGAFADGSSWNKIIPILEAKGYNVIAIQNPLSSLADDAAAAKRVLDSVTGPVVLVGHSWGGTVITQAGTHDKVKALVYVAAFAPGDGQSSVDTGKGFPTPPGITKLTPYSDGFVYLPTDAVAQDFVPDAAPAEKKLIAATQGPIRGKNFEEKISTAAWKTKPSFYIVATADRMIDPGQERAMAKAINATTTELKTGHVPMVSAPKAVADVIIAAARKVSAAK